MTLKEFLKDHLSSIGIGLGMFSFILLVLITFRIPIPLIVQVIFVWIIGAVWILVLEYRKESRFFVNIAKNMESLDQKYLIHEIIQNPNSLKEEKLLDILEVINRSMLEHLNTYQHSLNDYKEYVQLWIHEIKIPIASIRLMIENNKNGIQPSLIEELNRVENLVEQVLYYVRSESTEKDYVVRLCSLQTIVNEVVVRNKTSFIYNKISLNLDHLDCMVYTDKKWMAFILNQILSNALKYLDKEPACISIKAVQEDNQTILMVEDNGMGISAGDLPRVFEKGFTGENGRQREKSTGIGLNLCKTLCTKLHHGIHLSSELGKGTRVTILFPAGSLTDILKK